VLGKGLGFLARPSIDVTLVLLEGEVMGQPTKGRNSFSKRLLLFPPY